LSLVGTIAGDSDGVALFAETGSQEMVRLRTGEAHQGWILRSVHGRQVMLEKGDRKETVTLPAPGDTAATGPPSCARNAGDAGAPADRPAAAKGRLIPLVRPASSLAGDR
jgi:hypothetical protein